MRILQPREVAQSLFDIDFDRLLREGKQAVIFDLDRTLGCRRPRNLAHRVLALLAELEKKGFKIGVLTNRRRVDGDAVIERLNNSYPLIHTAAKPRKSGFLAMLLELGTSPQQTVMVGDRLLTDILGANRVGIYSIKIFPT
jgi:HAD superfamily phosphatase (TIGR01668 family)